MGEARRGAVGLPLATNATAVRVPQILRLLKGLWIAETANLPVRNYLNAE